MDKLTIKRDQAAIDRDLDKMLAALGLTAKDVTSREFDADLANVTLVIKPELAEAKRLEAQAWLGRTITRSPL